MRCSGASSGSGRPCEGGHRAAAGASGRRRAHRRRHPHPHPFSRADHQWAGYRRDAGAGADDGGAGPRLVRGGASLPARQGTGGRVERGRALRPSRQAGARLRLPRGASRALDRHERRARHPRVRQTQRAQRFRARIERQDIGRGRREKTGARRRGGGGRPRRHPGGPARRVFAGPSRPAGPHPGGRSGRHSVDGVVERAAGSLLRSRGQAPRAGGVAFAAYLRATHRKPRGDRPGRSPERTTARHGDADRQRVRERGLGAGAQAVAGRPHQGADGRHRQPAGDQRAREHAILRRTLSGSGLRAARTKRAHPPSHPDLAARQFVARVGRGRQQGRGRDFQAMGAASDAPHRSPYRPRARSYRARSGGERVRRSGGLLAPPRRRHRGTQRLGSEGRVRWPDGRDPSASLRPRRHPVTWATGDRDVQDRVIRALADARYRASPAWQAYHLADPDRVERYARFLARHFYHERIVQFFKYSRSLARVTGRPPEGVLKGDGFDLLLPSVVLGSRETAQAVARLVVAYVAAARAPIPYLADLLRYEEAMMLVEAGPRVWRETGTGETGDGNGEPPQAVEGTLLLDLQYDLPAVLPRLLEPWTEVPRAGELRRFAQKFGVRTLIDRDAKRFAELGLGTALLSEDRWLEKLALEPLLLRMPLVRHQQQLTVGPAEDTWRAWVAAGKQSA